MIDFKIRPEKDVPVEKGMPSRGRGRPMNPVVKRQVEQFAAMRIGESFFVEGLHAADVEYLRKPFIRAGLGMLVRRVERDEIYKKAGVRVWRLAGEYDEL